MRHWLAYLVLCVTAATVPLLEPSLDVPVPVEGFPGWPTELLGHELRKVPLGEREARFFEVLPGYVARFTDGERQYVLRWVKQATRHLHPAVECFRGTGYEIGERSSWIDPEGRHWGSFEARRGELAVSVRELVYDEAGHTWADVSAWFWAALLGETSGPYWSLMVVEAARVELGD